MGISNMMSEVDPKKTITTKVIFKRTWGIFISGKSDFTIYLKLNCFKIKFKLNFFFVYCVVIKNNNNSKKVFIMFDIEYLQNFIFQKIK